MRGYRGSCDPDLAGESDGGSFGHGALPGAFGRIPSGDSVGAGHGPDEVFLYPPRDAPRVGTNMSQQLDIPVGRSALMHQADDGSLKMKPVDS